MRLGIMQPYFFPYIGYWQLMDAVDKYVIYDDVNYIKGGWINRNRILVNGEVRYFNLRLSKASPYRFINEIELLDDRVARRKLLDTLQTNYSKAPYYKSTMEVIRKILESDINNLAAFLTNQIQIIASYLSLDTEFILSSSLKKDCDLKGEDKVISICKILGADTYINAIGGKSLYSNQRFLSSGLNLFFLQSGNIEYSQFGQNYESNLSIVDTMMFCSPEEIKKMLKEYTLE